MTRTPIVVGHWTSTATIDSLVRPDGTVDLMWTPGRMPWLACPDTGPSESSLEPGSLVVGVQLAPGAVVALTDHAAPDVVNLRIPANDITTGRPTGQLCDALHANPVSFAARVLTAWVTECLGPDWQPDPEVLAEISRCRVGLNVPPSELSPRQLRRRFAHTMGYGPKFFEKVCRFDRFVGVVTTTPEQRLADAAADAGFCDQSHLTRDCRELTGRTPAAFVEALRLSPP